MPRERAIAQMGDAYSTNRDVVQAYVDQLKLALEAYPQLEAALRPLISQGEAQIDVLNRGGQAAIAAAHDLGGLAGAQEKFATLSDMSVDQAQQFLNQLVALRTAYPHTAEAVNTLITAVEKQIETQKKADEATTVHVNSLDGLRAKREELVKTYNAAPIGSAAQAEALQAIRATDAIIEANDQLAASHDDAAQQYEENIAAIADAQELLGRGLGATSDQLFQMAINLGEASQAAGETGEQARYLQTQLVLAAAAADAQAEATERYERSLDTVTEAQTLLGRGTAVTSDELFSMAISLGEAANLSGALGEEARQLQIRLVEQAVAMDMQARATEDWARAVESQSEYVDTLKGRLGELADSFLGTISPIGDLSAGLQEIDRNARLFGDTAGVAEAKAALYRAEMDRLGVAGKENGIQFRLAAEQYEFWQSKVESAEQAATQWTAAVESQTAFIDRLKERLGTLGQGFVDTITPIGDLNRGLAEIDRNARLTGDSSEVLADKADLIESVMKALADRLGEAHPLVRLLKLRFDEASDAADRHQESLDRTTQALDAFGSLLSGIADRIRNSGTSDALDEDIEKRDELLEGGEYDPSDLEALNEDIDDLSKKLEREEMWAGFFEGAADAVDALTTAFEEGATAAEQAFAAIGAGLEGIGSLLGENGGAWEAWSTGASNALAALAKSDFWGFLAGTIQSIGDLWSYYTTEIANYDAAVQEHGKSIADRFKTIDSGGYIHFDEEAYNEFIGKLEGIKDAAEGVAESIQASTDHMASAWGAAFEASAEALENTIENLADYVAEERELQEESPENTLDWARGVSDAIEDLADAEADAARTLASAQDDLFQSRIDLAETTGASKVEIFIAETQAAMLAAHAAFQEDMADLTEDKKQLIDTYLAANPGATYAEAEAYAEGIIGPQRDALRETYANTVTVLLADAEERAKELGLSQKEFWRAIMEGDSEILGDMSEQQRLAYLEYIQLAQELGTELPKWLEDMYENIHGAQVEGGVLVADGTTMSNEAIRSSLTGFYDLLRKLFGEDAEDIIGMIEGLYTKQAAAHRAGGLLAGDAAEEGNGSYREQLDGIYAILRQIFGEDAEEVISFIEGLYTGQAGAHEAGAAIVDDAIGASTGTITGGVQNQAITIISGLDSSGGSIVDAAQQYYQGVGAAVTVPDSVLDQVTGSTSMLQSVLDALGIGVSDSLVQSLFGITTGANGAWPSVIDVVRPPSGIFDLIRDGGDDLELAVGDLFGRPSQAMVSSVANLVLNNGNAWPSVIALIRPPPGLFDIIRGDSDIVDNAISGLFGGISSTLASSLFEVVNAGATAWPNVIDALTPPQSLITSIGVSTGAVTVPLRQQGRDISGVLLASLADVANVSDTAWGGLSGSFEGDAQEFAAGIIGGSQSVSGATDTASNLVSSALSRYYTGIANSLLGGGNLPGSFASEAQELASGIISGSQGVSGAADTGSNLVSSALTRYYTGIANALLGGGNLTGPVLESAQRIAASFIQGSNIVSDATTSSGSAVATAIKIRDSNLLSAITGGSALPSSVLDSAQKFASSFSQGASIVSDATSTSANTIATAIRVRDSALASAIVGSSTLPSSVIQAAQGAVTAFATGSSLVTGAIEQNLRETANALVRRYTGVSAEVLRDAALSGLIRDQAAQQATAHISGGNTISSAVGVATSLVTGALQREGDLVQNVIGSASSAIKNAQEIASSALLNSVRDAAAREVTARIAGSNAVQSALARASSELVGDVRESASRLVSAQNTGSNLVQGAIQSNARDEAARWAAANSLVSGAVDAMQDRMRSVINSAYNAIGSAHSSGSNSWTAIISAASRDESSALQAAQNAASGRLGDMQSKVASATQSAFSRLSSSYRTEVGNYIGTINDQRDKLQTALDRIAALIKNFRYPSLPAPPRIPQGALDALGANDNFAPSTSLSFESPFSVGAYAADSFALPDYAAATSQTRAYAAATGTLLDLFDSNRTLALTSTQERALNLTVTFTGFSAALAAPMGVLERAMNSLWEISRFNRETSLFDRETAELWRTNVQRQATRPGVKLLRRRR